MSVCVYTKFKKNVREFEPRLAFLFLFNPWMTPPPFFLFSLLSFSCVQMIFFGLRWTKNKFQSMRVCIKLSIFSRSKMKSAVRNIFSVASCYSFNDRENVLFDVCTSLYAQHFSLVVCWTFSGQIIFFVLMSVCVYTKFKKNVREFEPRLAFFFYFLLWMTPPFFFVFFSLLSLFPRVQMISCWVTLNQK